MPQGQPHPVQPNQRILPLTADAGHRRDQPPVQIGQARALLRRHAPRIRQDPDQRIVQPLAQLRQPVARTLQPPGARALQPHQRAVHPRALALGELAQHRRGHGPRGQLLPPRAGQLPQRGFQPPAPQVQPLPRAFGQRSRTTKRAGQIAQALARALDRLRIAARHPRPGLG